MDTKDIQKRLDALIVAMLAKGLPQPDATFTVKANAASNVFLMWKRHKPDAYGSQFEYHHCGGKTTEAKLDAADALIAALPSGEEAKLRRFMDALGDVIDQGRETGIEVAFINPLTETMKKLSENALTYQKAAAE